MITGLTRLRWVHGITLQTTMNEIGWVWLLLFFTVGGLVFWVLTVCVRADVRAVAVLDAAPNGYEARDRAARASHPTPWLGRRLLGGALGGALFISLMWWATFG